MISGEETNGRHRSFGLALLRYGRRKFAPNADSPNLKKEAY